MLAFPVTDLDTGASGKLKRNSHALNRDHSVAAAATDWLGDAELASAGQSESAVAADAVAAPANAVVGGRDGLGPDDTVATPKDVAVSTASSVKQVDHCHSP